MFYAAVMPDYMLDDLIDAQHVFEEFVEALKRRDDSTVLRCLFPPTIELNKLDRNSISQSWIDGWGVPEDELQGLGFVNTARVLNEELVGFAAMVPPASAIQSGFGGIGVIDSPHAARALALIKTRDGWKIWGSPDAAEWRSPLEGRPMPPTDSGAVGPVH